MFSVACFCPKPKNDQFTITQDKEKQQIRPSEKLELEIVWFFSWLIFEISAIDNLAILVFFVNTQKKKKKRAEN